MNAQCFVLIRNNLDHLWNCQDVGRPIHCSFRLLWRFQAKAGRYVTTYQRVSPTFPAWHSALPSQFHRNSLDLCSFYLLSLQLHPNFLYLLLSMMSSFSHLVTFRFVLFFIPFFTQVYFFFARIHSCLSSYTKAKLAITRCYQKTSSYRTLARSTLSKLRSSNAFSSRSIDLAVTSNNIFSQQIFF